MNSENVYSVNAGFFFQVSEFSHLFVRQCTGILELRP